MLSHARSLNSMVNKLSDVSKTLPKVYDFFWGEAGYNMCVYVNVAEYENCCSNMYGVVATVGAKKKFPYIT